MPYCERCQSWFPWSIPACQRCGGALPAERPASIASSPVKAIEEVWEHADSMASLPDRENEHLGLHEALGLVDSLDAPR
ncbi:MAG: hypothetical protein ACC726_12845, partial [Chloroflexota bacterium]